MIDEQQETEAVDEVEEVQDTEVLEGEEQTEGEVYDPNETARETTERIFKELKEGKSNGNTGEEGQTQAKTEAPKDTNIKEKEEPDDKFDPELTPPERLKDRAKVMFNNLPKGLKREFHRAIREIEAGGTRVVQDAHRALGEVKSITEAVAPFATKWAERGFTIPAGIAALCAAQERLSNPETSLQKYLELGAELGHIDALPDQIKQYAQQYQNQRQNTNILQNPEFQSLQERQEEIIEILRHQQLNPIVSEMEAVRQEVDPASGRPRYPELADESYLLSLKTRVSEIVRHDPNISYADALRAAADERRQLWFGYSSNSEQTRIPTANNNQQKQRAVNAAVSVRGKTNSSVNGDYSIDPPPEALISPRATAEWALRQIKSGRM